MNEGLCQISNFNIQFLENVSLTTALQRQNTEISKQIFPEKEYQGLSPNFHIHASVSDLRVYISTIVCLFCWSKYVDRSWDYINLLQTHECGNWGWGRGIPRNGIHKWDFRCSVKTGRDDPVFLEILYRCMKTTSEMYVKSCANICIKLRNFGAPVSFCCHTESSPWAQLKDIKETVQPELNVLIAYYWIHLGQYINSYIQKYWMEFQRSSKKKNRYFANVSHVQMYIVRCTSRTPNLARMSPFSFRGPVAHWSA